MSSNRFLQRVRRWDWEVIAFVLLVKLLLFACAAQGVIMASESYDGWMEIWQRWDAVHYLHLAENGYSATGDDRFLLVFFPLYPWLVRGVEFLTRDFLSAAFVVSGFASIAVALLMEKITRLDADESIARHAVWLLFIFPTSYFLHIPYTEGLFLALVLACFLAARCEHWLAAGVIGACACLTRANGLVLCPALALEAFSQYRATRRINFRWLWIAIVPLGFVAYLFLNYQVTGDFFAFSQIQHEHWYKKLTPPWIGIRDVWLRTLGENPIEGLHEFIYIIIGILGVIWCWLRTRPGYAMWVTGNFLLVTSTSFVLSVPRYTLTFFPLFILVARACRGRPLLFAGVTIFSLLSLGLYAGRFARGLWAF
ncbi:MAG: hypothetical protein ACXWGY_00315 [Chthoniobacterales bacterium]